MREHDIRHALAPYAFDGTEAVASIMALLTKLVELPDSYLANPYSSPFDLRAKLRKILEQHYQDTVPIDAVVNFLDWESQ
jgi:hypothetical protein